MSPHQYEARTNRHAAADTDFDQDFEIREMGTGTHVQPGEQRAGEVDASGEIRGSLHAVSIGSGERQDSMFRFEAGQHREHRLIRCIRVARAVVDCRLSLPGMLVDGAAETEPRLEFSNSWVLEFCLLLGSVKWMLHD